MVWEFVGNAESQALPQTGYIRTCSFAGPPCASYGSESSLSQRGSGPLLLLPAPDFSLLISSEDGGGVD